MLIWCVEHVFAVIAILTRAGKDQDKRKIPIGTSEIAEGLLQRHGVDNGIVIECGESCRFYCFETCEEIDLHQRRVRVRHFYICPPVNALSPPHERHGLSAGDR